MKRHTQGLRRSGVVRPGEISYDDEPLVPRASRNVFPRVSGADSVADSTQVDQESSGAMPMTVLATPEAVVEVGREVPFDRPPSGPDPTLLDD